MSVIVLFVLRLLRKLLLPPAAVALLLSVLGDQNLLLEILFSGFCSNSRRVSIVDL